MAKGHHRDNTPGGSQRQLRVGELVRHAMSDLLTRGEVHDPVLEGHLITVPEVRMSPDLRLATIYVIPLGGQDIDPVLAALVTALKADSLEPRRAALTVSRPIPLRENTVSTTTEPAISCPTVRLDFAYFGVTRVALTAPPLRMCSTSKSNTASPVSS